VHDENMFRSNKREVPSSQAVKQQWLVTGDSDAPKAQSKPKEEIHRRKKRKLVSLSMNPDSDSDRYRRVPPQIERDSIIHSTPTPTHTPHTPSCSAPMVGTKPTLQDGSRLLRMARIDSTVRCTDNMTLLEVPDTPEA
jgi:hypothetical protein